MAQAADAGPKPLPEMSPAEFRSWSSGILARLSNGARSAAQAALDASAALVRLPRGVKNHVESSFNSGEGLSALKILLLYNHKVDRTGIVPADFIRPEPLRELLARLNPGWDWRIVERLLGTPLPAKRNFFGLSADFRVGSDACQKFSVYVRPQGAEAALSTADAVGVPREAVAGAALEGLSTVAVDFSAQDPARAVLKLYTDGPPPSSDFERELSGELEPLGLGLHVSKELFDREGRRPQRACDYYLPRRGGDMSRLLCANLRAARSLSRFAGFLSQLEPSLVGRQVNGLGLKEDGELLEVYVQ